MRPTLTDAIATMSTTPLPTRAPQAEAPRAAAAPAPARRVTDAPTRTFHALFALGFIGAYVTAESERWRQVHVALGYAVGALLLGRLVYGLVGPRHARLSQLLSRVAGGWRWWQAVPALVRTRGLLAVPWTQGLQLLLAPTLVALLLTVPPLLLSGLSTFQAWGGPRVADALAELHEGLGEAGLALAAAHAALVVGLSLLRRRNLARPMLDGRSDGSGPDRVSHDRAWAGAVLLLATVGGLAACLLTGAGLTPG